MGLDAGAAGPRRCGGPGATAQARVLVQQHAERGVVLLGVMPFQGGAEGQAMRLDGMKGTGPRPSGIVEVVVDVVLDSGELLAEPVMELDQLGTEGAESPVRV